MRALSLLVSIVGVAAAPMTWSQTLEKLSFTLRAKCVDDGSQSFTLRADLVNISCREAVTGKLHAAQFQPRDDIDPAADKSGCRLARSGAMECELSKAVPHMFDQLATDDALNQGALDEGGLTGEFGAAAGDDGSKTQDAERAFFQEYKVRGCTPAANRQPPTSCVVPPPLLCPRRCRAPATAQVGLRAMDAAALAAATRVHTVVLLDVFQPYCAPAADQVRDTLTIL
jgi:hypothetical protein